jgi:hypothetical protein
MLNIQSSDQKRFHKFEKAQSKKRLLGDNYSAGSKGKIKNPSASAAEVIAASKDHAKNVIFPNPGSKAILLEETKKTLKSHFLNKDKEAFVKWLEKFEDENCVS